MLGQVEDALPVRARGLCVCGGGALAYRRLLRALLNLERRCPLLLLSCLAAPSRWSLRVVVVLLFNGGDGVLCGAVVCARGGGWGSSFCVGGGGWGGYI